MNTLVEVRFVRAWKTYSVGSVIRPTGVLRDWLVRAGFVEIVKPTGNGGAPHMADQTPAAPAIATKAKVKR